MSLNLNKTVDIFSPSLWLVFTILIVLGVGYWVFSHDDCITVTTHYKQPGVLEQDFDGHSDHITSSTTCS